MNLARLAASASDPVALFDFVDEAVRLIGLNLDVPASQVIAAAGEYLVTLARRAFLQAARAALLIQSSSVILWIEPRPLAWTLAAGGGGGPPAPAGRDPITRRGPPRQASFRPRGGSIAIGAHSAPPP